MSSPEIARRSPVIELAPEKVMSSPSANVDPTNPVSLLDVDTVNVSALMLRPLSVIPAPAESSWTCDAPSVVKELTVVSPRIASAPPDGRFSVAADMSKPSRSISPASIARNSPAVRKDRDRVTSSVGSFAPPCAVIVPAAAPGDVLALELIRTCSPSAFNTLDVENACASSRSISK